MKLIKQILFSFLFLVSPFSEAQELPPIKNFTPTMYGAENQNWSISQSSEKYIYVGNNKGLLEFDGENWKLYPSPNNTIIRSVKVIEGKVFTGAYMEFGYWEKNEFGNLIYNSISDKISEKLFEDEQFWEIVKLDNWILFQSLNRIYIYDLLEDKFQIIDSEFGIYKLFKVGESLYFQKKKKGLFKIESGEEILVSNHEIIKNNILVNIYNSEKSILFVTQESGFYFLKDDVPKKWDIKANSALNELTVFSSIKLRNGNYILGTISNGFYQLNINGEIITSINQKLGLENNTILSVYEDQDLNLWLGLDYGISNISLNSSINAYNDIDGKLGTVYASCLYKGNLYLGTNQGLFYKKANSNNDFKFIDKTNGQVWCLEIFDDTLFCGHNTGTFVVSNNSVELISSVMGTWDFEEVKTNNNLLIQGNYDGLHVLEKKDNKWSYRNQIEGDNNVSCMRIYLDDDNRLFVSHEYKGVLKMRLDEDLRKVTSLEIDKSAPRGFKSSLVNYNNDLIYAYEKGIFKFNYSEDQFEKDELLTKTFLDNDEFVSGKFIVDKKSNTLWGFTNGGLATFTPSKLSKELKITKISLPVLLRQDVAGYENISHLYDQKYLIGTSRGYIIIDLDKIIRKNFEVNITAIKNSVLDHKSSDVALTNKGSFESFQNNFYFFFSVPEFDKFAEVNYSYKLSGIYNDWTRWSTNGTTSFENLPIGKYELLVKAQVGNKVSDNIAAYKFEINRPWYFSNLMIGLYSVLLVLIIVVVNFMYKQNFNKQKRKLIYEKQREFAVSKLESEKVIMELTNERLQNEIDSKTRELSASTMSIIKKNEFLNTIKGELESVKDDSKVKPVIKIINKNLTNKGDWDMFQDAFNNADSNFLKKVKSIHPVLTPNDLRLCAYLRLNLSSKEIAPLLNISVRSVEIKRYRLRKKMELQHENSLVEYILGL